MTTVSCGLRRRSGRLLVAVVAAVAGLVLVVGVAPASAGPDPCAPVIHVCASDVGQVLERAIPGLAGAKAALDRVASILSSVGQSVLSAGVAWFTHSIVEAAGAVLADPGGFVDAATRPQLTAAAFLGPDGAYHRVASFAVVILVAFVFLGVIQGLLGGAPGQALFRIVRDTPAAVLAIIGFPWLVDQLIGVTDGLCAAVLPSGEVLRRLIDAHVIAPFGILGFGPAQLLMALIAFAATVLVFLELLVRNILVQLLVALAPLSFAAIVWPAARPAARKVGELTIAGVLAKPAIYIALKVGLDLIGEHSDATLPDGSAWGKLLVGLAVVCLAAFTPWVVWRLLPHAEAYLTAQGISRMPARAGMQALQTAYWVDMIRHRTGGRGGSGHSGRPPGPPGGGLGPARRLPTPPGPGGGTSPGGAVAAGPAGAAVGAATAASAASGRVASAADRQTGAPATDGRASGSAGVSTGEGWVRRPRGSSRRDGTAGPGTRSGR